MVPTLRSNFHSLARLSVLSVLCVPLMLGQVQATNLETIQASGVFRVAFSTPRPPLISQEGSSISGFLTELLNVLSKQMKVPKVVWQKASTPQVLVDALQAGTYDAIIDTDLPTPLGGVSKTQPIACTGGVILTRPGGPTEESDLKGKRIAVVTGSSYFYYVRNLSFNKTIKAYDDESQALVSFLSGSADVLVTDRYAALKIFKQAGATKIQVGPLLWSQNIAVVVSSTGIQTTVPNGKLISLIDANMVKALGNGSYANLSKKYFGQDVRCVL